MFKITYHMAGVVFVWLSLLYGCSANSSAAGTKLVPGVQQKEGTAGHCSIRELPPSRLIVEGGRQMYVEPMEVKPSRKGDILLAGSYNYLFEQDGKGEWNSVNHDSLFGAVVFQSGRAQMVQAPIPTRLLSGIRATALDDGTWAVVFAEVEPWSGTIRSDKARQLWYGVLDGTRWRTLESIPIPPGATIRPIREASSLVRRGDRLAWAMGVHRPGAGPGIIVYERHGGQWSYEVVPTGYAQAEIAYSDTLGLVLAAQQADSRLARDSNSLLLWARHPTWRILRSVVPGSREQVHRPSLAITALESVLTWEAVLPGADGESRHEAHAMVGQLEANDEAVITLDAAVTPTHPIIMLEPAPGQRLWVIDHLLSDGKQREIRFVGHTGPTAALIGSFPNRYMTPFRAIAITPTEILLTGGLFDRDEQVVVSLLVRAHLTCTADVL